MESCCKGLETKQAVRTMRESVEKAGNEGAANVAVKPRLLAELLWHYEHTKEFK